MGAKILAIDLGGTHMRLAWVAARPPFAVLKKNQVPAPRSAVEFCRLATTFWQTEATDALGVAAALAGPVTQEGVALTNLPWYLRRDALAALGQHAPLLLNDLAAHAAGLAFLPEDQCYTLQEGKFQPGNRVLIAAGTGLGESIIAHLPGGNWLPLASEGGHCDFAPRTPEHVALLRFLQDRDHGAPVCWEQVLSGGQGWQNLCAFVLSQGQHPPPPWWQPAAELGPLLSTQAQAGDAFAGAVMDLFVSLYGAEAGNLALKGLALGGVYLGGGIAPQILSFLDSDLFRRSFCDKHAYQALLEDMPIKLALDPDLALRGAAASFARQYLPDVFRGKADEAVDRAPRLF